MICFATSVIDTASFQIWICFPSGVRLLSSGKTGRHFCFHPEVARKLDIPLTFNRD